jgi:hypothetical protein
MKNVYNLKARRFWSKIAIQVVLIICLVLFLQDPSFLIIITSHIIVGMTCYLLFPQLDPVAKASFSNKSLSQKAKELTLFVVAGYLSILTLSDSCPPQVGSRKFGSRA